MSGRAECDCNVGGSINEVCDKTVGQCFCQPRIVGRACDEPMQAHYFPTLHQFTYEAEDSRTPTYTPVRYGFDEKFFPEYSWKGYAVFSQLQVHIILTIIIFFFFLANPMYFIFPYLIIIFSFFFFHRI